MFDTSIEQNYYKNMIDKNKIIFCIMIFTVSLSNVFSEETSFTFNLAFIKKNKESVETVSFKKPIPLINGDEFQLYIKSDKQIYCYIIYEDVNKNLITFYNDKIDENKAIYFPSDTSYFKIGPPSGREKFYILTSYKPFKQFEEHLSKNDNTKILDFISRLKNEKSLLAEAPEKPAPMGGVSRSTGELVATSYSGDSSYVKTIRFKH